MRLLFVTVSSAVLLSGCSWFGGQGGSQGHQGQQAYGQYGAPQAQNWQAQNRRGPQHLGPCQISHRSQPAPRGCDPAAVTIATGGNPYGGFPQQPNFAGGYSADLATGGFGSHSNVRRSSTDYHVSDKAEKRRPRLRGQLYLGAEKSISGDLLVLDPNNLGQFYNRADFVEGFTTGSAADGQIIETEYTSIPETVSLDSISFEDAYSTPLNIRGGFEYIISPKTTVFANAGYVYAEGERVSATIQDELRRNITVTNFDPQTGAQIGPPITNIGFIPNVEVARIGLELSDVERIDLEVGARQYFNPILKNSTNASITPFVGVSGGAARYNDQSVNVSQSQLFLERAFESSNTDREFFDVLGTRAGANPLIGQDIELFDAQWVPTGTVTAGLEWQATPRTAIAFETGIRYEGGRDDVNDVSGDDNISIPFTIRGSYNF